MSETISFEIVKTNETRETLFEKSGVDLKVKFYWDSHGKLVEFIGFNDKKSFSKKNANVRVENYCYTAFESNFEDWGLFLDDKKLNGNVYRYSYNPNNNVLHVKFVVGWG